MIQVTKTYLPDKDKYKQYIDEIYESGWITNNGKFVQKLENRLKKFLDVENIILVSNGTLALQIAYMALGLDGSVITTPFSFIATTSSLVASKIKPVFCDIDKKTFNLNANLIEKYLDKSISAIVPTHIFGNACEIEQIEQIANKHNLKVVYDASHCFGVKYENQSILNFGDISTISFHATKLFHTIEGGALVVKDNDLAKKIRYMINFGIENEESILGFGINAKMNEFEAAMGLCVLDDIDLIFKKREEIFNLYKDELKDVVDFQLFNPKSSLNYSFMPVLFKNERELKKIQNKLLDNDIGARRYFYPSLDTLQYTDNLKICSIARDISSRILCLPIFVGLKNEEQSKIIDIIKGEL